jgi:hypothetical protein
MRQLDMTIKFTPVTLDSGAHDNEAMLLFRDGKLLAVLSCLDHIHEEMQGWWYVETIFNGASDPGGRTFRDLAEAEVWANAA